jgi:hypothetical protein
VRETPPLPETSPLLFLSRICTPSDPRGRGDAPYRIAQDSNPTRLHLVVAVMGYGSGLTCTVVQTPP